MTGRFLLAVLLLSLVGQIFAQGSLSITTSISISITVSNSISASNPASISNSGSVSATYSNSISPPVPVAPQNLTNSFLDCASRKDKTNHIYYLCLAWVDPAAGQIGQSVSWILTYTPAGGSPTSVTTLFPAVYLPGLTPGTTYTISIVGVNNAGTKSAPLVGTQATAPTDAKTAPSTKDLQNLTCANGLSTNFRKVINCQWGLPPTGAGALNPSRIDVKGRCIATGAKNKILHRSLKGTVTSVQLPVHRAQYTCYIEIFGEYINHIANDGHGHKFVQTCSSSTGCVKVR